MDPVESYWRELAGVRRYRLTYEVVPRYVRHFALRPFRKSLELAAASGAGARLHARHSGAALDAWVQELLVAWQRLADISARKESGQLAIRYIRLMAAWNREFEYRLATAQDLQLTAITTDPLIAARIEEWERFAALHTRDADVIRFMSGDDLVRDYEAYIAVTTEAGFTSSTALQLESIRLDSGGYLARLVRLIGRFNGTEPDSSFLEKFHDLGTAAKFADELADVAVDHHEGRYNLLLTLLRQRPIEQSAVLRRLQDARPLPVTWWLDHCPETFGQFSVMFQHYYRRLRSPELRRMCDLTMVRAVGGQARKQGARPVQHVSESPRESWR